MCGGYYRNTLNEQLGQREFMGFEVFINSNKMFEELNEFIDTTDDRT